MHSSFGVMMSGTGPDDVSRLISNRTTGLTGADAAYFIKGLVFDSILSEGGFCCSISGRTGRRVRTGVTGTIDFAESRLPFRPCEERDSVILLSVCS